MPTYNGLHVPMEVVLNVEAISADYRSRRGRPYPPTHQHAGSDSKRAGIGLPGHCEPCAVVGCTSDH